MRAYTFWTRSRPFHKERVRKEIREKKADLKPHVICLKHTDPNNLNSPLIPDANVEGVRLRPDEPSRLAPTEPYR